MVASVFFSASVCQPLRRCFKIVSKTFRQVHFQQRLKDVLVFLVLNPGKYSHFSNTSKVNPIKMLSFTNVISILLFLVTMSCLLPSDIDGFKFPWNKPTSKMNSIVANFFASLSSSFEVIVIGQTVFLCVLLMRTVWMLEAAVSKMDSKYSAI
jgi:hypothetical protein